MVLLLSHNHTGLNSKWTNVANADVVLSVEKKMIKESDICQMF